MTTAQRVVVFHRGALGDVVLAWPAVRALRRSGADVTFISDGEKAKLTASELGIRGEDIEQGRFNALWRDGRVPSAEVGVRRVISTVAGPGSVWALRAKEMYPDASIELTPGPLDRVSAFALAAKCGGDVLELGPVAHDAAVVLHVGAGSAEKRWPMRRWAALAESLNDRRVSVIAGEVEAERFSSAERGEFEAAGGRFVARLSALAEELRSAAVVVGADSGPGHLAAQMGRRVVSLFGPTDPERWAPIGPGVTVIALGAPKAMSWLEVDRAAAAVRMAMAR